MKKSVSLIFILLALVQMAISQENTGKINATLLIIDIQNFYFPEYGKGLHNPGPASLNAGQILRIFRDNKQLVVHVRHKSNKGFEIHKNVEPVEGEKVITKTEINSFYGTDLLKYLQSNHINRLIIIGMQTHMCLEAAVRAARDYGFECIVVQDACATRDVKFGDIVVKADDVHFSTLSTLVDGGYAKVTDLSEFVQNSEKYLFQKLN